MSAQFHIVLPPRERIGASVSGAVGLVVAELYPHSCLREGITVWGGPQNEARADFHYQEVSVSPFRLQSRTIAYARKLASVIKDTPQTYIEVHNRVNVYQMLRQRHAHSRIALFLHNDPQTMGGAKTSRERTMILESADAVICVSDFVRRRFLEGLEDPHGKTQIIYNGLDMTAYPGPEAADTVIVFAGRMVPDKGVLQLAQALRRLLPRHPDWKAEFIGASRLTQSRPVTAYERQVIDTLKPLGDQVAYLGALPNAQVQAHLRRARIAVIPSLCHEALGRVALEAMANGCAVVTSGRGGLVEAVGEAGLVVDPEAPDQLVQAIETLILNTERAEHLRQLGYRRMQTLFDVRVQAKRLDALRARLIEGPTR